MIWNNLLRLFRNSQEILQICITFYLQEILWIFKWAKNNQLKLMNQTSQNNLCQLASLLQRRYQCNDLSTHIALFISELIYLMFLCQLVSLLQEQITIDLVDWVSHSKWVCYNDNSLDLATNHLLFISSTTYLYSQNWQTTARWYVLRTEWNIYYMSETTKI